MIIDCISDLHGHYPELEGGDLLIVAGDLTAHDTLEQHSQFRTWLMNQKYTKKVFIPGNHDNQLMGPWPGGTKGPFREDKAFYDFDYLCDSGTEFDIGEDTKWGRMFVEKPLKIWGSPWTKRFPGMNPKAMAFTVDTEEELAEKWAMIPPDIDILITHSPPFGILDEIQASGSLGKFGFKDRCGSKSLTRWIKATWKRLSGKSPKIHIFGHIHQNGGKGGMHYMVQFINASHVNERYEPVNKPIRVIL